MTEINISDAPAAAKIESVRNKHCSNVNILVAVALSTGSTWIALRAPQADHTITEIVDGHMRSLMSQRPIDVASSERHIVKPWFNGRIPQARQKDFRLGVHASM
jgi:hypothetical protein